MILPVADGEIKLLFDHDEVEIWSIHLDAVLFSFPEFNGANRRIQLNYSHLELVLNLILDSHKEGLSLLNKCHSEGELPQVQRMAFA